MDLNWNGQALECSRAERFALKQTTDQFICCSADYDGVRLRYVLEPVGCVGSVADNRGLLAELTPAHLANHHQPGMNPKAHLERDPLAVLGVERSYRRDNPERGTHRPLRVVFMGPRIAKVGQQPVAKIFGYAAAEPCDHLAASVLISPNKLAQFLRIEFLGKRRRPDQVAEHHGQLPPLTVIRHIALSFPPPFFDDLP